MKIERFCLVLTISIATIARGQVPLPESALTIKVVDRSGQPASGARVSIRAQDKDEKLRRVGEVDEAGNFSAQMPSFGFLYYSAGLDGFYSSWGQFDFERGSMQGDPAEWVKSRWKPWNPTVDVVLKKKGDPIPMYAKRINTIELPVQNEPVGFDFVEGDWTTPHGKGKTVDMIFLATGSVGKGDYRLTWTFPNPGDGIQVYPFLGGPRSELRSPTEAPTEGYARTITVDAEGRPIGQEGETRPLCFTLRVRTSLDDAGKVVTAYYGKIYPEAYNAIYYFNPTPNSRTLEFDLKRNLFTGLRSYERINEP
jgi:hypothetical protein